MNDSDSQYTRLAGTSAGSTCDSTAQTNSTQQLICSNSVPNPPMSIEWLAGSDSCVFRERDFLVRSGSAQQRLDRFRREGRHVVINDHVHRSGAIGYVRLPTPANRPTKNRGRVAGQGTSPLNRGNKLATVSALSARSTMPQFCESSSAFRLPSEKS